MFRGSLSWGQGAGDSGVRNMALPFLGGANFSETSIPHFQTYFMQIGHNYLYTTIYLKRLTQIILLCPLWSLSKMRDP